MKYLLQELWEWLKYQKYVWEHMSDERFGEILKGIAMLVLLFIVTIGLLSLVVGFLIWLL